jgi:RNA polymerase sigma-70 factor (ECF subfamily)
MEEEYLKNISKLDLPEIETLVHQYWHDIWQYAFFLTRKEQLAEDIAQDTFIQAFRFIGSFRGQRTMKTWLFKIARNIAFNYKKSAFFKRVSLFGFLTETRTVPSAEAEYLESTFISELWKAVLELPQNYREIIILRAHYGLSHTELSELLNISEGTVKSRLHRARGKLEKTMKEADIHVETEKP